MRPTTLIVVAILSGCAGANSQVATCQAEKEQLLATIRTQRDANRSLTDQVASLESRLDQAEKTLARSGSAPRLSKASSASPQIGQATNLSWRNPEAAPPVASSSAPTSARANLQKLAAHDARVKLDPQANSAQLELPLRFRDQSATLTAEDKVHLDETARLLKVDEARDLQIVIAGSQAARAHAVADYLDRHGIARERLIVSSDSLRPSAASQVQLQLQPASVATVSRPAPEPQRR